MRKLIVLLTLVASQAYAAVPSGFSVEGVLRDSSGKLQSMMVNVTASLFDAQTAGNKLAGPYGPTMVMATNGLFTFPISDAALTSDLGGATQVWLEIAVGSDTFARQLVTPQLYALMCGTADNLSAVLPISRGGTGSSNPGLVDISGSNSVEQLYLRNAAVAGKYLFEGIHSSGYARIGTFDGVAGFPLVLQDSGGNVGIGTASPVNTLDVNGNVATTPAAGFWLNPARSSGIADQLGGGGSITFRTGSTDDRMVITAGGSVGIGTATPVGVLTVAGSGGWSSSNYGAEIVVGAASVNSNYPSIGILDQNNSNPWAITNVGGEIRFSQMPAVGDGSANTERVVFAANGNVGIGAPVPDALLTVNGSADKPGGGAWATFSDVRLKNIKGAFATGLAQVMQLDPIRYEYKRDNALGIVSEGEHIGFSAQAVQKVIPEAVTKNDRGYLLINNDPIIWSMLNAIKEQQHQIEEQQHQIEALRAHVDQLTQKAL